MAEKLTRKEAMVLRFVYVSLQSKPIVGVKDVADYLGVSLASSFEILNRLVQKKKLLKRIWRRGYVLTEKGRKTAEELLFTHRVVEVVLSRVFGMSPSCACEMATYIDYLLDISYANNAFKFFNYPEKCPCNKKIPRIKG